MKFYNTTNKTEVSKPLIVSAQQVHKWIKDNLAKAVMVETSGNIVSWDDSKLSAFENQQIINFLAGL